MQLNPAEISELIKTRIEGLGTDANVRNQGTVQGQTECVVGEFQHFALHRV